MNRQTIEEYYKGTGNNICDLIDYLRDQGGDYNISDDRTLAIFYFKGFTVVAECCGGLSFI